MAISFVGGVSGEASVSADLTLSLTGLSGGSDSSPSEGDIVLVLAGQNASTYEGLVTSGYTLAGRDVQGNRRLSLYYKIMGASPDSSVTIEGNNTFFSGTDGIAVVYRGVDTSTPIDATTATDTDTSGDPDPPAITTATDAAWVVACGIRSNNQDPDPPSGYTMRGERQGNNTIMLADKEVASSGSEDPGAFNMSGDGAWVAITAALRPGATGPEDLAASYGSYSLTGQAASFHFGYGVDAGQGAHTVTGIPAGFLRSLIVTAQQGSHSLSGKAAGLLRGHVMGAAQGTYSLSGQDVDFHLGVFILADRGEYALAGQAAEFLRSVVLGAQQGSHTLTGQGATLTYGFVMDAEAGAYSQAGQDVAFVYDRRLDAESGSYELSGGAAVIVLPGIGQPSMPVVSDITSEITAHITGDVFTRG